MPVKTIGGNLLFWKISSVFTVLLIALGLTFVLIASKFSKLYYTKAHQQLYSDIAQHLANFTKPIKNGRPDTAVTHDIIHSTMVANPSVEVYLLDTAGNITDFVVPDTTVLVRRVNMSIIKQWLKAKEDDKPLGDNPKQPGEPGIFSVAPVHENGAVAGYVYAVLASEKQKEILNHLNTQFYPKLSSYIFFAALFVALIVGLITFFLITDSICRIAAVVKRFKEGDYSARIDGYGSGNLGVLASSYNEMADVIVMNIDKITATDKFRQELIANVSHDLRTPLSIMQGYVETLMIKKETVTAADKEKYLGIVYDSTKKLSLMVEQLFQYAKLEANVITPEKEPFPINELASDVLMSFQIKSMKQSVQLKLESPGSLPQVFADVALTERVFQNLLDNALKFTPGGGSITIHLLEVRNGVKVIVRDSGTGISPEDQVHIFERYKQLGNEKIPKKGMGIGLAIVKKILELHQSSIEVVSEKGKGTAFNFVLQSV